MPRRLHVIVAGLVPFVIAGLLLGLLYNTLFYPRTLVEYLEAGTIGILLGIAVGFIEQAPAIARWFDSKPFVHALLLRTLVYSILVSSCLSLVLAIEPATHGECAYPACITSYVAGPLFVRDMVFSTVFVFIVTLVAQVVFLIGPRNFGRLVIGRYQRPRELTAEVMFVDLRGSTGIAERLGHERYSALLRDFFLDTSRAVHEARGEIYQYVGDEVVIVCPADKVAGRWVDCFLGMRSSIEGRREEYMHRHGIVPEFKAGVHSGSVVVTEVGVLQRALVYHGDVLNTAARIQARCNESGADLLASQEAIARLSSHDRSRFAHIGQAVLQGRAGPVDLFALSASPAA